MTALHDMHCHLDFMANGDEVARQAAQDGCMLFANTVTPQGWVEAKRRFSSCGNVVIGFGMHPWWVEGELAPQPESQDALTKNGSATKASQKSASEQTPSFLLKPLYSDKNYEAGQRSKHNLLAAQMERNRTAADWKTRKQRADISDLLEQSQPRIIGEIGLDLGPRHKHTSDEQQRVFSLIAQWAARERDRLISVHAVKAARETLDVLQNTGATDTCTCILHWFTGPSDQLKRAVNLGCYFSCGPRMLATAKGREYVKAIPANRLLLETDAPPTQGEPFTYEELRAELQSVALSIAAIKGDNVLDTIAETSETLLRG